MQDYGKVVSECAMYKEQLLMHSSEVLDHAFQRYWNIDTRRNLILALWSTDKQPLASLLIHVSITQGKEWQQRPMPIKATFVKGVPQTGVCTN